MKSCSFQVTATQDRKTAFQEAVQKGDRFGSQMMRWKLCESRSAGNDAQGLGLSKDFYLDVWFSVFTCYRVGFKITTLQCHKPSSFCYTEFGLLVIQRVKQLSIVWGNGTCFAHEWCKVLLENLCENMPLPRQQGELIQRHQLEAKKLDYYESS